MIASQHHKLPTSLGHRDIKMLENIKRIITAYEMSDTMDAIALTRSPAVGSVAEALEMVTVPITRPEPEEVAIRLCASSMHIDEIYAAQGTALGRFYGPKIVSPEQPHVLGSSVSGIVVGKGGMVNKFNFGDEVIVVPDHKMEIGSWADYRCVNQKMVVLKPPSFTHVEAAAITMAACVSWGAIGFSKAKAGDNCLVVGASGSIGLMIVQYLKSMDCKVTAVCSAKNEAMVLNLGADSVIDYTQENFADQSEKTGDYYNVVFDCIGGRDIEKDAFRALKKNGVFETVVGPVQYIGEKKLSWLAFSRVMFYVLWRMFFTLFKGPRYIFGEKLPRFTLFEALQTAVNNDIKMPIERVIPFQIDAVSNAVRLLTTHRARGRFVIDFDRPW